jgi:hypothetical protein
LNRCIPVVEIRDKHFNSYVGVSRPDSLDGLGKMSRSAIGQIIAGDPGNHHVAQAHSAAGLGHPRRLIRIQGKRFGSGNGAEMAIPGAAVAANHEGGRAFAPTFPVIRATGAFAHGMEAQVLEEIAGMTKGIRGGQL